MDSLIGKLRAIFISAGMGGTWEDNLGTGNPASHRSVKAYLQPVKEEQARARVRPKQANLYSLTNYNRFRSLLSVVCVNWITLL